jgi:uncharacterized protein YgiM (DUF1202 family)
MINKIKRLSTILSKIKKGIENIHNGFLKGLKIAKRLGMGILVYLVLFLFVFIVDNSTKKESTVLDVLTNIKNDENSPESSFNLMSVENTPKASLTVKEKIPDVKHAIFSDEESVAYVIQDASIKIGPELNFFKEYNKVKSGTKIYLLGYNEYNVAKILYDNKELYIDGNLLTNNKDYIFNNVDGVVYAKNNTKAYINLEDNSEAIDIALGQTIHVVGSNDSAFAKIEINNSIYYINKNNVSDSLSYKFENKNKTMYAKGNVNVKETQDNDSNILKVIESGSNVNIIGENNSNFYLVNVDGVLGYVSRDKLTDSKSSMYPFLTHSYTSPTKYNTANALDGMVAVVPEDQKTEENVYLLAKLIYCEAGGQGYDGQRAVATVVVNRMFDGTMGNTVQSVIYRPNQFSPVGSGKIERITPTKENIQAARDVLIDGYRSFPAYVLYFQSIRDGYWKNHYTYCTMYNNNWTHPQYFSYKMSDYEKYK